ncbi:MAG: c-type cytochrome [Gemmatimonadota bacterium]
MKRIAIAAGTALLFALGLGHAQPPRPDLGKFEYESNCASCHGLSGKGDGGFAKWAGLRMPDLTRLSARNGGVFPAQRLYDVIDGRAMVAAHGDREMPIWGVDYMVKARPAYDDYRHDPEFFVQSRIMALVNHLYSLQAK